MRVLPFHFLLPLLLAVVFQPTMSFGQSVTVGGGASLSLGAGTLNAGCGDLIVASAGILSINSGAAVANRNVNISGGTLNGGTGDADTGELPLHCAASVKRIEMELAKLF